VERADSTPNPRRRRKLDARAGTKLRKLSRLIMRARGTRLDTEAADELAGAIRDAQAALATQ